MQDLKGKVAVVTGAASGIGNAVATRLAQEGMKVVLADVEEGPLADAEKKLADAGATVLAVPTDVTKGDQVDALAAKTFEAFGTAHVVHNNAGVATGGPMWTLTEADWQWVLGVNLWGVIHGLEAFLPRMLAQKEPAHIVNTASMAGLVATRGLGIYNTSKYAVVGLSETLAKDLKPYNIGVSVLCPMGVSTRIRASERTRPAHLKNDAPSRAEPVELMGRSLPPEAVAEMVLRAILGDELYVITHDEGLEPLRRRFERMEQAIRQRKP